VTLNSVGILRGPGLNPYEGQFLEKLPKYGFRPVGITTYDNMIDFSQIHFPVRVGHSFKTVTKGKLKPFITLATKVTGYRFSSWDYRVFSLKQLTVDLDLIYSADTWYPYTYQALKTGLPTIVMEWENIPGNYEAPPYNKIKQYNRSHATYFVAITEKAKNALLAEGVTPDRVTVVPAGLDCERFKPQERNKALMKKFALSPSALKILFVGRLVPEKGIFNLLEAFSKLQSTQTVELLVVGSGTAQMQVQIKQFVRRLKIEHTVKFLGSISYFDMPQIHNLADIFCLPSIPTKTWEEQFGYSLVEAMACGKPVVSTFSGSIPEIIKHQETGILVKPNDSSKLESALEMLVLDKQKRDSMGAEGRRWVLLQFEANKVAKQLSAIFQRFV
jgi:starch synthase